jgi:hypothetical protein
MNDNQPEGEKLKDELVQQVQGMAALLAQYALLLKLDAYECTLEFVMHGGEGRIRLTDAQYRKDANGKLMKLSSGSDPNASSLDDAEARRQAAKRGDDVPADEAPVASPEQIVADMMKKFNIKTMKEKKP